MRGGKGEKNIHCEGPLYLPEVKKGQSSFPAWGKKGTKNESAKHAGGGRGFLSTIGRARRIPPKGASLGGGKEKPFNTRRSYDHLPGLEGEGGVKFSVIVWRF